MPLPRHARHKKQEYAVIKNRPRTPASTSQPIHVHHSTADETALPDPVELDEQLDKKYASDTPSTEPSTTLEPAKPVKHPVRQADDAETEALPVVDDTDPDETPTSTDTEPVDSTTTGATRPLPASPIPVHGKHSTDVDTPAKHSEPVASTGRHATESVKPIPIPKPREETASKKPADKPEAKSDSKPVSSPKSHKAPSKQSLPKSPVQPFKSPVSSKGPGAPSKHGAPSINGVPVISPRLAGKLSPRLSNLSSRAAGVVNKARNGWNQVKAVTKSIAKHVVRFAKTAFALVTNPVFWISVVAVILVLALVTLSQTLGKDDFQKDCDTAASSTTVNVGGDLAGNDDAKKIIAILSDPKSVGADSLEGKFGKVQIAALLGNWTIESGMHFNVTYGHANDGATNAQARGLSGPIGLVQWMGGRAQSVIDIADSQGKHWYDGDVQMTQVLKEFQGSYGQTLAGAGFFTTTDLKAATKMVQDYYEVPATPNTPAADAELAKRYAAAQKAMQSLGGSDSGSGDSGVATVSSECTDGDATGTARFGSTQNPGIQDADWAKASNLAKATVNTAIDFVQDDKLFYQQLPPNPGGYDCSAFVTTVIELSTGYTYAGVKVTKKYDPKDFFEHRDQHTKKDLQWPAFTGSMLAAVPKSSPAYIGMSNDPGIVDKLQPGDVFVNDEHTRMYAGHRATDGKLVWVQSSCPGCSKFKDIATSKPRSDMGVSVSNGADGDDPRVFEIYRPYVLMK